jgi:ribosomal protein L27
MAGELAAVAAEATSLAVVAARTYGRTVLAKAWDNAGDASVRAGVRMLQRIFGRRKRGEQLPPVISEVIKNPDDEDYVAQLRLAIRKALETDEAMASEIAVILREVSTTWQPGQHVASGRDSSVNFFARDGFIAGRDIKFFGPSAGRLPLAG